MRVALLPLLLTALALSAQTSPTPKWGKLLDQHKTDQAEQLCKKMQRAKEVTARVEAEKCLANVELAHGQQLQVNGSETGGGFIGTGYTPEAIDKALIHLNAGIALAPQDMSLYKGRLHLLEVGGRYDAMAKAMDETIILFPQSEIDNWLAYASELGDMGMASGGIQISQVILKHYPNDHRAIGNLGAFYNMAGKPAEGLPYLERAAHLAPTDAMDVWNVGWAHFRMNQITEADTWLQRALALDPEQKQMPNSRCLYAGFVERGLKDKPRACKLQQASCEKEEQTACVEKTSSSSTQ